MELTDQPRFVTIEEMRQAEVVQAEREVRFWKYGHMFTEKSDEELIEAHRQLLREAAESRARLEEINRQLEAIEEEMKFSEVLKVIANISKE